MAKKPRKPRIEQYEALKQASGWYLAAWRDYRGLTLEELASEAQTSKGMVSDLETGARNSKGDRAQRFNRDWVEKFAAALDTTGGFLIDVNPYSLSVQQMAWGDIFSQFNENERELAINLVKQIPSKKAG